MTPGRPPARVPPPAGTRAAVALLSAALLAPPARAQAPLFASDTPLTVTLRTDLRALYRDRDPDTTIWRGATLTWQDSAGPRTVSLRLHTRGRYRLRECDVPPIRLRFDGDSVRGTLWERARRPKLVTHCADRDEYEQNLLQEYAIYRVYQLLTPVSFRARLLRVTYEDEHGAVRPVTRYAIVTEDPERLAERVGGTLLEVGTVRQSNLRPSDAARLGVFQYLIANTDWSVPGQSNIQLVRTPDTVIPVPYDFDWAGVIDARYAHPDPRLGVRSVRIRVYRGLCQDAATLAPVLDTLRALREGIAAVYRAVPGLAPRAVERTLRYYGEFYQDIADPQRFVRDVVRRTCLAQ